MVEYNEFGNKAGAAGSIGAVEVKNASISSRPTARASPRPATSTLTSTLG